MSALERTLGVLGGMGPAATLDFLAKLQRATDARTDQDHVRVLMDLNPEVPDRNAALADAGPSPAAVLAAMAAGLERAGADGLVIACNSAHAWAEDVRAALQRAPLISMVEETVAATRRDHPAARRVGLLAATACIDARLYQQAFERVGVSVIAPEGELRERFMATLYRIKAGDVGGGTRGEMVAIARALIGDGAEVIVSGCTEVPLALGPDDLDLPLVDSTDALVAAALVFARGG